MKKRKGEVCTSRGLGLTLEGELFQSHPPSKELVSLLCPSAPMVLLLKWFLNENLENGQQRRCRKEMEQNVLDLPGVKKQHEATKKP